MSYRSFSVTLAAAALGFFSASAAPALYAQDSGDNTAQLQEVTVSATRRTDTNLQTTPISVSALTSTDIERSVSKDISGLASLVPGFSAARVTAFNAASFAMRGVGITDIIVYQDSPVGVQYDDFVMPSVQTQLLDTFDIAGVEVLRGPQGTLFGKNTTGGAVNIKSKRPNMQNFGGEFRLGAAKFGEKQVQAALDLPIVADKFGVRLVGSYIKSDGYYRLGATYGPIASFNTNPAFGPTTGAGSLFTIPGITGQRGSGTGERTGGQDVVSGRIKAQWNVTENFTALAQLEMMRDRSDAVPSYNDTPPTGPYLWNFLGFTRPAGDPLDHVASTQRNDSLLKMGEGQRVNVDGAYLNLDWKLGDHYTLYSVSGYRKQEEHLPNTYTGAAPVNTVTGQPLSLFDATRDTSRVTTQQEFRLASKLDGAFNFVGGLFFQRNDAAFCVIQLLGFVDLIQNFGAAMLPQQLLNNAPQVLCNNQKSTSKAAFIDATFNVTDRFQIGAGFRHTEDEKSWAGRVQGAFQGIDPMNPALSVANFTDPLQAGDFTKYPGATFDPVNCSASYADFTSRYTCTPPMGPTSVLDFSNLKTKWSEPSWRATASYKLTDDAFSYLTISRGYKAGGYNDQTATSGILVPELTRPVNPEFATNYELGFKTQWLNDRLRINPTVFVTKYKDAQRATNVFTVKQGAQFQETVFYNAAQVKAKGAELEVQAAVTDRLQLRLAASHLDAKYDNFVINQPGITKSDGSQILAVNQNLTGLPVPRSPKNSGSLTGIYNWPLASGSKMQISGDLYYEDKNLFYISAAGRAFDAYLDSKTLFNAAVGWTSADNRWSARVYGRNLGDKRYRIASQSVATLWTHSQFGEPRNYGIQVGLKLDGEKKEAAPAKPIDSDGDGVTDDIDRCPATPAGTLVDASGCPLPKDSDGDGVMDPNDKCPNTPAGAKVDASGCELDADGDGVVDRLDKCPNTVAGAKVNADGCEMDADGDGVVDRLDKCPDTPKGDRVDYNGCSFKKELQLPGVVFETNKADLLAESSAVLDGAVSTLKRYPELQIEVAGHTDSTGSAPHNAALSKARAETVMKYLSDNGVTNTLKARGYGEKQPVASNKTADGKQANRRVVLRILNN